MLYVLNLAQTKSDHWCLIKHVWNEYPTLTVCVVLLQNGTMELVCPNVVARMLEAGEQSGCSELLRTSEVIGR